MTTPAKFKFPAPQANDPLSPSRVANEATKYLNGFHWDLYTILTFKHPVSEDHAERAGKKFIERVWPWGGAALFWGAGAIGGRLHIHALISLSLPKRGRTGLDVRALNIKRAKREWRQGWIKKLEPYDPRRRATEYLPTHHEMEIVGALKRHRSR